MSKMQKSKPDMSKVVNVNTYKDSMEAEKEDFEDFLSEAKSELEFYDWCLEIRESYVGIFYAGVIGIFLFRIRPSSEEIDEWIWVIVGDIPPLYLTCETCPNAACALDGYIGAMEDWVKAAERGEPVDGLAPVGVTPNPENARKLKRRLEMLDERVLSLYEGDL